MLLVAAILVTVAGVSGWVLAGPPEDRTAIVPPACPAVLAVDAAVPAARATEGSGGSGDGERGAPGRRAGVPDALVPMPLPQPRGPVSVRVCGYRPGPGRAVLDRQAVLDPTRTAALAGRLNASPGAVVTPAARPAGCPAADRPVVLIFRYTEGDPALVEVAGGPCAVVATSARVEQGRGDVVRYVADLLADGGRAAA